MVIAVDLAGETAARDVITRVTTSRTAENAKGAHDVLDIATVAERCRWARDHNEGTPSSAWSTDEQLAVALVLRDKAHLEALGCTLEQATDRVCERAQLNPFQFTGWLNDVRGELERSGSS